MKRDELVKKLREAAEGLTLATTWESSYSRIDRASLEYVFEFVCYLHILKELKRNYTLSLVKRVKTSNGKAIACWPKAPANKSQWSYFKLRARGGSGDEWQLCAGTGIADKDGHDRHPDISLQRNLASDWPNHDDVVAIWDAKFRKSSSDRLACSDIALFLLFTQQLQIAPSPVPPPLARTKATALTKFGLGLEKSGLISNGSHSTEPDAMLSGAGIHEIVNFWHAPKVRP